MDPSRILIRATNWIGDAVMSLPALEAVRHRFPSAHIAILARPWVSDVYQGAPFCDAIIPYTPRPGMKDWSAKLALARCLEAQQFDTALILPNSFDSALICRLAKIPVRIGYSRDARGILLTHPIARPKPGEIPKHERFYYLELLRRAAWLDKLPDGEIHLTVAPHPFTDLGIGPGQPVIGLSPGAAFGTAKRWLPERFAESAALLAGQWSGAAVAIFGSKDELPVATEIARNLAQLNPSLTVLNLAGKTSLREFMERIAACHFFLTNDNGAMHLAAAIGVPTLAIFGSTDHSTTGPTGPATRIVREPVDCSPCLKRECPIDHRCMTRVTVVRVIQEAIELGARK